MQHSKISKVRAGSEPPNFFLLIEMRLANGQVLPVLTQWEVGQNPSRLDVTICNSPDTTGLTKIR